MGLLLGWALCVAAIAGQCLLLFYAELGGKRSSLCRPLPALLCLLWQCCQPGLTAPLVLLCRPPALQYAVSAAFLVGWAALLFAILTRLCICVSVWLWGACRASCYPIAFTFFPSLLRRLRRSNDAYLCTLTEQWPCQHFFPGLPTY